MGVIANIGRLLGGLSTVFHGSQPTYNLVRPPTPELITQPFPNPLVVLTTSGLIQGRKVTDQLSAYLGIPYAQPPLGDLRFAAPVALDTPDEPRIATAYGPSCLNVRTPELVASPSGESEDCLTVNVFTSAQPPAEGEEPGPGKPVFLWMHPGSFNKWSSALEAFNLGKIAAAHPDVIFVSFNYRLNALGFPSTPALSSPDTNLGLRDHRLVVEWVHNNIAAFGGDPERVVIGGESAGSIATSGYLFSQRNNALIAGAVTMSGTAKLLSDGLVGPGETKPDQGEAFEKFATAAGCKLGKDGDYVGQLICLRNLDSNAIYQGIIAGGASDGAADLQPSVDGEYVFTAEQYDAMGAAGEFSQVPLLTGTTNNEGDVFVIKTTNTEVDTAVSDQETIVRSISRQASDATTLFAFTCSDRDVSKYWVDNGVTTYRYRYMPKFPSVSVPPIRAGHTSDIFPLFGTFGTRLDESAPGAQKPDDVALEASAYMMQAFTDFVRDPTNGLETLGWKKYAPGKQTLNKLFEDESVDPPLSFVKPEVYDKNCAAVGK